MNEKPTVAVLFTHARTHYRELPGVEVWDRRRDARGYPGPHPVVAHPPCRVYSRYLSKQAKAPPDEYTFAIFALAAVRAYGGVLEHPRLSHLWDRCALPPPGQRDAWGFTIEIWQWWFGYPGGKKRTWLYCCGVQPDDLPPIPYRLWTPGDHERWRHMSQQSRAKTPLALCEWLVSVARLSGRRMRDDCRVAHAYQYGRCEQKCNLASELVQYAAVCSAPRIEAACAQNVTTGAVKRSAPVRNAGG